RVAAWGLAGALTAAQTAMAAKGLSLALSRAPGELEHFEGLRQAVTETGAEAVMAPRQWYPLNYAWGEALPVSDGILEFYGPIRLAAELAENPAYFADWKGSGVLFDRMGLECQRTAHGRVFHDVKAPPQWRVEAWRLDAETPEGCVELALDPPRAVSRVGFFIHGLENLSGVPMRVDVAVRENGEWRTVHENEALPAMTWTGTRAYLDGGAYQEFPVSSERAEAVRVVARGMLKHRLKRLDLLAYGTDAEAPDTAGDAEAAVRTVLALAGDDAAVFAPRWLANRLHRSGGIEDDRNRGLSARMFGRIPPDERATVPPGGPFVAAVERRYAGLAREAFASAGIAAVEAAEDAGGAWTFFRGTGAPEGGPSLRWNDRWFMVSN
ncbi:MAG: hypothetical protein IK066_08380, partial [Kiritimatiellae bacterium]|nr:hypothetical protein [Kiritimatiellia bacterium]